jgi:hypothetical protein
MVALVAEMPWAPLFWSAVALLIILFIGVILCRKNGRTAGAAGARGGGGAFAASRGRGERDIIPTFHLPKKLVDAQPTEQMMPVGPRYFGNHKLASFASRVVNRVVNPRLLSETTSHDETSIRGSC